MVREKACIVTPTYFSVGGTGRMVRHLINILTEKYEVIVLSIKWIEDEKRNFIHYDIALNSKLRMFINPWHVPSLLLYELSGVMWCIALRLVGIKRFLVQEATAGAFFTTLIAKIIGSNVFLFDYGPMLSLYDKRFLKMESRRFRRGLLHVIYAKLLKVANGFAIRHCHKFFIYSQEMKKCARAKGLKSEKIVFYNFPIDTAVFKEYSYNERNKIRERLAIKKSDIVVTFIGRISEDKGLLYLLEAIKFFIERHNNSVKFLIAGEGPLLKWFLNNTASYEEQVSFLGPLYSSKEVVNVLNASDIFVYPITMSYGYALSVLEAMATGLPTIITEIGPTKELVINGQNGFVVPVKDSTALIKALTNLIGNKNLRKRMGKRAKEVLTRFSVESYSRIILDNIA
jgi:glycosyltransferase involved in cell wall biosynthesis